MKGAPKSVRLHIGLFGRTNVGKSSFLNFVLGQDLSITSPVAGTTTDIVEKTMELLPIGPVVFLDTGGLDDVSLLSKERIKKTNKIFDRSDVIILIAEPNLWGKYEQSVFTEAESRNTPVIVVINKVDTAQPKDDFLRMVKNKTGQVFTCSCLDEGKRDDYVETLKKCLFEVLPREFTKPPSLLGNLVPKGGLAVLIVPIDMEAPKGRIILPQVQAIRSALDAEAAAVIVKEDGYVKLLDKLKVKPDIVICDSQVVDQMVKNTPQDVPCTTFSILFAHNRGNLASSAAAVASIKNLVPNDRVLILEACSHHPIEDDIGRRKIPIWLNEYVGGAIEIDVSAGRDYPEDFSQYKLIIHCGGCMITKRETFFRFKKAAEAGVAMTNYGVCISFLKGVLDRVLSPFAPPIS